MITSKNKVISSGIVWHAKVPIPSFVVNIVGEIDCYKPNPLTKHRKWCLLHSNLSHPGTKNYKFLEEFRALVPENVLVLVKEKMIFTSNASKSDFTSN